MVVDKYGREVHPGDVVLYSGCTGLSLARVVSTKEEHSLDRNGKPHRWQSVRAKNIEHKVYNSDAVFNLYYFVKVDNIVVPAPDSKVVLSECNEPGHGTRCNCFEGT